MTFISRLLSALTRRLRRRRPAAGYPPFALVPRPSPGSSRALRLDAATRAMHYLEVRYTPIP